MIAQHERDWLDDTTPSSRNRALEASVARTAARTRKSRVQVIRRRRRVPWVGAAVAVALAAWVVGVVWVVDEIDNEPPRMAEPITVTQ